MSVTDMSSVHCVDCALRSLLILQSRDDRARHDLRVLVYRGYSIVDFGAIAVQRGPHSS
jgi:hypothetical protein